MLARAGRIALLLFQALWLLVVVPGHTRGVILLPGSGQNSCCHLPGKSGPADSDSPRRKENCAICSFAARLSQAIWIDLTLPPMQLLRREPPPAVRVAPNLEHVTMYLGRAPPDLA